MISVDEASQIINAVSTDWGSESIPLLEATGRVLKQSVSADRDFPPFDRVAMDGIALSSDNEEKTLEIIDVQLAGQAPKSLERPGCIEVMTGAVLPDGCDTIVPYEQLDIVQKGKEMRIAHLKNSYSKGQHIHRRGSDRLAGSKLLDEGTLIRSAEIGILATIGMTHVKVAKLPKTVIISSGDELVEINEKPKAHQIRRSNVYSLRCSLQKLGIQADLLHLTDDKSEIEKIVQDCLKRYDVLILSGAVSKGKADFLPTVLDEIGVQKHFHRVAQRPGKPMWFGNFKSTVVFALPGNPVSTYLCCLRYILPWLKLQLRIPDVAEKAILGQDFRFKPNLTFFLQAKLRNENGILTAYPEEGHGSGDLANLAFADAFIELPNDHEQYSAGDLFSIHRMI